MSSRPDVNTYWVVPGRLLAGEYPGAMSEAAARDKLRAFLKAGLTCFVDLTESHELKPYARWLHEEAAALGITVEHWRMPIRDVNVPRSRAEMMGILDTIDQKMAEGHGVYVHCWGGIGRTGTVIGCYLVRHGHTGQQALDELAQHWTTVAKSRRRPHTQETPEQVQWVLNHANAVE